MKIQNPLATVIVPVYKVEEYLPACIESIQAQTYENLQILLIDDGSPDKCGQICDSYAEKDARIQAVHQENGGVGSARNAGLAAAKGDYIFFVDSDDYAEKTMVERAVKELEAGPYDLCAWGMTAREGENSQYRGRNRKMTFRFRTDREKARFFCRWFLTSRTGWEVYLRVFRKEIIERYHLRFGEEIFAEDMDFTFRYLIHCENFRLIPEPLYTYRIRPGSAMQTIERQKQFGQILRLLTRQKKDLAQVLPFQKFYVFEGVALAAFIGEPLKGEPAGNRIQRARDMLKNCTEWEEVLEDARLAAEDSSTVKEICGYPYGALVCALYQYFLDGDIGEYEKRAAAYHRYLKVKDLKTRLLHPGMAKRERMEKRDDRNIDILLGG